MRAHDLHHRGLGLFDRGVVGQRRDRLAAEVRSQDDQRVGEIDRAPLSVGEAAVVEHLQEDVEDVGMRLFDLVEQRSEEHTSELQSLMRLSYAVFCLKKKTHNECKKSTTKTIII